MSGHQPGSVTLLNPEAVEGLPGLVSIDIEACNRLGSQHYLAGDFAKAEECFIAVIRADPNHALAWCNLGFIWQLNGFLDDALKCYMRSYELKPDNAALLTNMGFLNKEVGHMDHAIRMFERALEIEPGQARAMGNLGESLLYKHDFARAWPLLEARFRTTPQISVMREYPIPIWNGKPCRKLAIWPEQGVGDQILYTTLLPELIERGQDFVCELDARLLPAYHRSFPTSQFVPRKHEGGFEGCDAHSSMMSLCQHFRQSIADFEHQPTGLLLASSERVLEARHAMGPCEDQKRVAISWRSFHPSINISKQTQKSASLADFALLGRRDDIKLVTVQYGAVAEEIGTWAGNPIHHPGIDLWNDIDGILAVIEACDAVVTTSNVTAHFAGALGKETYLIYRRNNSPFFYWASHNGRSLWYPEVRIVTGEDVDTWEKAIERVSERLPP